MKRRDSGYWWETGPSNAIRQAAAIRSAARQRALQGEGVHSIEFIMKIRWNVREFLYDHLVANNIPTHLSQLISFVKF